MRQLTSAFVVLSLVMIFCAGCGGEAARPTGSGDVPQPTGPMPGVGAPGDAAESIAIPAEAAETKTAAEEAKPDAAEKAADAPKAEDKKSTEDKPAEPAKPEKE